MLKQAHRIWTLKNSFILSPRNAPLVLLFVRLRYKGSIETTYDSGPWAMFAKHKFKPSSMTNHPNGNGDHILNDAFDAPPVNVFAKRRTAYAQAHLADDA